MNLKFITNIKAQKDKVTIGKNGHLRFKKSHAIQFGFLNKERWVFGIDEDERICKSIYVVPSLNENEGVKMQNGNGSFFLPMKSVCITLKLNLPLSCNYEPFNYEGRSSLKIILP
jgi:hypothetical protein